VTFAFTHTASDTAGGSSRPHSSRHGFVSRLALFFWGVGQLKPCVLRRGRRRRGRGRLATGWRLGRRRRTRGGRRTFLGRSPKGRVLGSDHRVRQVDPERLVLLLALAAVVRGGRWGPGGASCPMPQGINAHSFGVVKGAHIGWHHWASGKRGRGRSCGPFFDRPAAECTR